jgi:proteasome lid subunit RPN8/RPN11
MPSEEFSRDDLDIIYRHAVLEYPFECCGIVTKKGARRTVHPCRNIQNTLHAEDPQRYPRDARTAYTIERAEAAAIFAAAARDAEDIAAFYHSHPDHDAYFSDEDLAVQTVFGEPEFPNALHIIVSVRMGAINGVKCFRWDGKGGFIEV